MVQSINLVEVRPIQRVYGIEPYIDVVKGGGMNIMGV